MVKLKSKKIMFVVLMGIITCLASLFICFGQNAYADEDEFTDESVGYVEYDNGPKYFVKFTDIHDLITICNKDHADIKSLNVYLEKDLCFDDCQFHVDSGREIIFNLCGHKIYKKSPTKNAFFWVAGTLNLNGDSQNRGTIESAQGTTNASVISDKGHITANFVDFISKFTEDDDCPDYASHLYFTNMIGESEIRNCNFIGGCARYGASVYLKKSFDDKNSSVNFIDCYFDHCYARRQGGAIYNQGDNVSLKMNNTTIKDCKSTNEGGAVLAYGKDQECLFYNVTIEDCSSVEKSGGAVYLDYLCKDQVFSNCSFKGDVADYYGGAVHINGYHDKDKAIIFDDCIFDSCRVKNSDSHGGAVNCEAQHVNLKFNNTSIVNCSSSYNKGGAVATMGDYDNATFKNCTINKCKADSDGGAIYNESGHSDYKFIDTDISNCETLEEGGAIATMKDDVEYLFDNSKINNCKAKKEGGAFYVYSSNVKIIGTTCSERPSYLFNNGQLCNSSVISNCSSDNDGGAIYTSNAGGHGNDVVIDRLNFVNNYSSNKGGAIYMYGIDQEIYRCCFASNVAKDDDGAIGAWNTFHNLEENEFFDNHAKSSTGANTVNMCSFALINNIKNNKLYYLEKFNLNDEFQCSIRVDKEFFPIQVPVV